VEAIETGEEEVLMGGIVGGIGISTAAITEKVIGPAEKKAKEQARH
jgi:hypothetical protein